MLIRRATTNISLSYPEKQIKTVFGEWIEGLSEWQIWFTGTFKFPVKDTIKAKKYFKAYIEYLKRVMNTKIDYAVGIEDFASGESVHNHSLLRLHRYTYYLLAHKPEPFLKPIENAWRRRWGIAKAEIYHPGKGANYYLGKYIAKRYGKEIEFDFDVYLDK